MPRWMKAVDSLDAGKVGGPGFALSAFNPANVAVVIPSMMLVTQAHGSMAEHAVEVGLFTLVAAAQVILAVAYYLVGGSSAHAHLDQARAWLTKHNAAALLVLLVGLGILLTVQGVTASRLPDTRSGPRCRSARRVPTDRRRKAVLRSRAPRPQ